MTIDHSVLAEITARYDHAINKHGVYDHKSDCCAGIGEESAELYSELLQKDIDYNRAKSEALDVIAVSIKIIDFCNSKLESEGE